MEDVLAVYTRPHDANRPLVCLDETSKQLTAETRAPLPMVPGRTAIDYAHVLKQLSDVHFPQAEAIVLVQDNLNTHAPSSLYQAFPPAEAQRIAGRFEWHYTPKHGSWLNMAEAELSVLARQCLARRIPDVTTLEEQLAAWLRRRNKHHLKADWRFTTKDARIKLKNLYPVL